MFFQNIKVLIWDFDGTLYKPNPALFAEVREAEYKTIQIHTGWERAHVIEEFNKLHKKVYPSATETVGKLTGRTTTQAALEMENYFDRRKFLQRDEQLIKLFKLLKRYKHYILANGVRKRLEETLDVLGIPKNTFQEIVTSEIAGENKPSPLGFHYILGKTGLPPDQHLMIGDRELVDLAPAKALGMKTCLVWSDKKSDIADATLPDVYSLPANLTIE